MALDPRRIEILLAKQEIHELHCIYCRGIDRLDEAWVQAVAYVGMSRARKQLFLLASEQARPFYEALFADLADGRVTCIRRLYGDGFLVDESLWRGTAVGRPFGFEGRGRPLEFRLLHVLEFTDDGQIARENVWIDSAGIAAVALGLKPHPHGAPFRPSRSCSASPYPRPVAVHLGRSV